MMKIRIALFSETYLLQINGVATQVKTLKEGMDRHSLLIGDGPALSELKELTRRLNVDSADVRGTAGFTVAG